MLYAAQMGHDAQILSVSFDVMAKSVSIRIAGYKSDNARDRQQATITFEQVTDLLVSADINELLDNHGAGNVNHWHIAQAAGTSYLYLVEGYIAITAAYPPSLEEM